MEKFFDFLKRLKGKYLKLRQESQDAFVVETSPDGDVVYVKRCIQDRIGYACDSKYLTATFKLGIKDHVTIVPSSKRSPFHVTMYLDLQKSDHRHFILLVNSTNSAGTRCALQKDEVCVNLYVQTNDGGQTFRPFPHVERLLNKYPDIRGRYDVQMAALRTLIKLYRNRSKDLPIIANNNHRHAAGNSWRADGNTWRRANQNRRK